MPAAWSSAEMPSGTFGTNVHAGPDVDRGEFPGHRHGASVGWVIGHEVDGLYDPHARDELDENRVDDVRVRGGLACAADASA